MPNKFSEFPLKTNDSPLLSILLFQVPVFLTLGSLIRPPEHNYLPATDIFEFTFFFSALLFSGKQSNRLQLIVISLMLWVTIRIVVAWQIAPVGEIFRAHKWLLYLIALCFFVGSNIKERNYVIQFSKFLISVMTAKYVVIVVFFGLNSRPGVFTENNFELFFAIGLFAVVYKEISKFRTLFLWLLIACVSISGSRSAVIGLIVLIFYVVLTSKNKNTFIKYIYLVLTVASLYLPFFVFSIRNTTLENLDRLKFFNSFLIEIQSWDIWSWLIGNPPITPLSIDTCNRLAFYESLLSSAHDGSCYSVIFHSFFLRVIFDFGLFGLVVAVTALFVIMSLGRINKPLKYTLLLLSIVNGISVSGQNNVYVILPIAYALMTAKKELSADGSEFEDA